MRTSLVLALAFVVMSASAERFTVPREAGRHLPGDAEAVTALSRFDEPEPVDVAWVFSYADARRVGDGLMGGMTKVLPDGGIWRYSGKLKEEFGYAVNVKAPMGCIVKCGRRSVAVKASPDMKEITFPEGGELTIESSGPVEVNFAEVTPVELFTVVTKSVRGKAWLRVRVVDDGTIEYSDGRGTKRVKTDKPTGGRLAEGAYIGGPFLSRNVKAEVRLVKGWARLRSRSPRKTVKSGIDASKRGAVK